MINYIRLSAFLLMLDVCTSVHAQPLFNWGSETLSQGVRIQNSLPVGMGYLDSTGKIGYIDSIGKVYGYLIFFHRVTNETNFALSLTLHFPGSFPSPNADLKLFLPPDTMTLDKEEFYNYGIKDLKSYLDTSFNTPSTLEKILHPKEGCLFYTVAVWSKLGDTAPRAGGVARSVLVLKKQDLFYSISGIAPQAFTCGQITFKK